ncbi:MAG: Gfo/Idh/MocA family oxidoreductase [Bradymonadia bacterium]
MSLPRIAVIGAGAWGRNLIRNFNELGALALICDAHPDARSRMAELYPDVPIVDSPEAVWRAKAEGLIDGVAVAAPAVTHAPLCRAALEADLDVFVEKPLALRVDAGQSLVDLARTRDRILMVGHLLRYHPAVTALEKLVRGGQLGRLRHVSCTRLNFGKIRDEENILWSFAPHDISLILHFVGEQPRRVQAMGGAYLNPNLPDVTLTHLEFPSGVNAHVHVSWLHPYKEQRLVLIGERGMAVFDDQAPWESKLVLYPHEVDWVDQRPVARKATGDVIPLDAGEPLKDECAHFLARITDRQAPITDGAEGLAVLQVLEAAQRALDEGRPIELEGEQPVTRYPGVKIHPTAEIDGPVEIGEGTRIWHFSKLLGPLRIGERCNLGQNVVVERNVTLGNNVKVQNNVSIYQGVILEDDVFCGPSMVFTNVRTPRSHVSRRDAYEITRVCKGASIGANATIVCGVRLGRFAFVGAGAVVTADVPDHGLVYGNPARLHGWACQCGAILDLGVDPEISEEATCTECGATYTRQGMAVALAE